MCRQTFGVKPKLIDFRLVASFDIGLPAVADHERLMASRVRTAEGIIENLPMWFLDSHVFLEDQPFEVRRKSRVLHL